ncbi:MAG: hypothetical protein LQ339_000167 [Xanthoria mediterranea]|nr:MAG: hypothetical protein LQ339_000167 [Xanthoria mediterranea]
MTGRNYTEGNDTMGNYTTVTYIATNGTGRNITERYLVFRNVKDYGARGDGFTDDTAAINPAISSGGRGAPGVCQSSTTSPANVYFPSGTYRVSSPIIDYYFTQIIGNPNNLPTIKATTNFSATAVIDGNPLSACVGLNITNISPSEQAVGSATFIDSNIHDTPIGVLTSHALNTSYTNSSLVLENVKLSNVRTAVQGVGNMTLLFGTGTSGTKLIAGWAQGHSYTPDGPSSISGMIPAFSRPQALLDGDKYYERSKPQYADQSAERFTSVRSAGAKGDGVADDYQVLQDLIIRAASTGRIVLLMPESKIVGEAYPVIVSSGFFFANTDSPQPVIQVGQRGEEGCVGWSDTIVATQGPQPGAIAIQWNLVSSETPSSMWDVHVRIGGFAGSRMQLADCPATPDVATPSNKACVGAHTSMHVTPGVRGLYLENVWLWTADHDLDDATFTNITVYAGRGLNMQAEGNVWLFPFAPSAELLDPQFSSSCNNGTGQCSGWGLRTLNSQDIGVYACLFPNQKDCQKVILSIEGSQIRNTGIYNLNTVGASSMVDVDGRSVANAADNVNVFPDTIAVFNLQSQSQP